MVHCFKSVTVACVAILMTALLGCQQQRRNQPDEPAPRHKVIIVVETDDVDPATGEKVKAEIPFWEGDSHNDDPTKPARRGKPVFGPYSGWEDPAVLRPERLPTQYGDFTVLRDLNEVVCATEYVVAAGEIVSGNQQVCAGMAAQFNKVKQAVMNRAIEVAKRCWRHPSCAVVIHFQSLTRDCTLGEDGQWYLMSSYEVRVVCFTL